MSEWIKEELVAQADELRGMLWCGIPINDMSKQELLGVIVAMRRLEASETKYHQERLDFLLGGARRRK